MVRALMISIVVLLAGGCGERASNSVGGPAKGGKLHILCSFFPMYLFTKNVVGDAPGVTVELMLPAANGCPHGYDTLSPADAKKIALADVFVVNGAGLEEFDETKIKSQNSKVAILDSSKGLKLLDADDDEHDHKESEKPGHHHDGGKNPHCFTSPFLAAAQVRAIAEGLAAADAEHAKLFRANAAAYATKLERLGEEFKTQLAKYPNKKIVTMHEIFDYLAKDGGFDVVGEIQTGAGVEATSPRKLIDKIKQEKVRAVFKEPQYSGGIADTIAKEAGVPVLLLDPVASGPNDAPADYYEKIMRENLAALGKAFGGEK